MVPHQVNLSNNIKQKCQGNKLGVACLGTHWFLEVQLFGDS